LFAFNGTNGNIPLGGLVADSAGNLYGTTDEGGTGGAGEVFELAAGTHAMSTLVAFNGTNGANPTGPLSLDAAGNIYGTTQNGGANSAGTVFELAAGTHTFSNLAVFDATQGGAPTANVAIDSAGNIYGLTLTGPGGNIDGSTLFEVAAGTHVPSTVVAFGDAEGARSRSGLTSDAAGNLYGTTETGGEYGDGNVIKFAAGTHALSTLATFNGTNGYSPMGGLIEDAAGNLFGTTLSGGEYDFGSVFEIAAGANILTTLYSFDYTDGQGPATGNLLADASGNLYGTTDNGGPDNDGTSSNSPTQASSSPNPLPSPCLPSLAPPHCCAAEPRNIFYEYSKK
jgi:uncharacterized repeat protein (TIGR03803 family)